MFFSLPPLPSPFFIMVDGDVGGSLYLMMGVCGFGGISRLPVAALEGENNKNRSGNPARRY